jgi:hypothetical protein
MFCEIIDASVVGGDYFENLSDYHKIAYVLFLLELRINSSENITCKLIFDCFSCNIVTEFGIHMKLVRLITVCVKHSLLIFLSLLIHLLIL